jgi:hypothetical protein
MDSDLINDGVSWTKILQTISRGELMKEGSAEDIIFHNTKIRLEKLYEKCFVEKNREENQNEESEEIPELKITKELKRTIKKAYFELDLNYLKE